MCETAKCKSQNYTYEIEIMPMPPKVKYIFLSPIEMHLHFISNILTIWTTYLTTDLTLWVAIGCPPELQKLQISRMTQPLYSNYLLWNHDTVENWPQSVTTLLIQSFLQLHTEKPCFLLFCSSAPQDFVLSVYILDRLFWQVSKVGCGNSLLWYILSLNSTSGWDYTVDEAANILKLDNGS